MADRVGIDVAFSNQAVRGKEVVWHFPAVAFETMMASTQRASAYK